MARVGKSRHSFSRIRYLKQRRYSDDDPFEVIDGEWGSSGKENPGGAGTGTN
jgi:hypothetical protein